MIGASTLQRLKRLSRRAADGCVVLYYHRVAALESDPQRLCVPPNLFRAQLDAIRNTYRFISVRELVAMVVAGERLGGKSVAVTFDDGYADNLHGALPVLTEFGLPAACFVSSAYIGADREFWWDELERICLQSPRLPAAVHLRIEGRGAEFGLSDASARRRAYKTLCALFRGLPGDERNRVLAELQAQTGVPSRVRESHRPLSVDELRALGASSLMEVGAHTLWHSCLGRLSADQQRSEIIEGRRTLDRQLGHTVDLFSYPFGQVGDFTDTTIGILRELGFRAAFTTAGEVVRNDASDAYSLPRVCMGAFSPEASLRMLQRAWDD